MKNKENIIIALIIFTLPLQYPLFEIKFLKNLFLGEYIFLISLLLIDRKKFILIFKSLNFIDYSVIFFLLACVFSFIFGSYFKYSFVDLIGYVYLVFFYFILKYLFIYVKKNKIYNYFLFTSIFVCAIGFLGLLLIVYFDIPSSLIHYENNYPYFGEVFRIQSTMKSPTMFNNFMSIGILISLIYFLEKKNYQYLVLFFIFFIFTIISLTKSTLPLFFSIFFIFIFYIKINKIIKITIILNCFFITIILFLYFILN